MYPGCTLAKDGTSVKEIKTRPSFKAQWSKSNARAASAKNPGWIMPKPSCPATSWQ